MTRKAFLIDHRYDPFEIYNTEEFLEELKDIPDPKKEPLEFLDIMLQVLLEMGPWSADRVAFNMYQRIEKQKIKTPHERHYILLCLVNTALLEIHAICEQNFRKIKHNKDCVETYSSPKVLRLLEVLRLFKPEDNTSKNDSMKRISMELDAMDFQKLTRTLENKCHSVDQAVEKQQLESRSIVENLDSIVKPGFQTKLVNDKFKNDNDIMCNNIKTDTDTSTKNVSLQPSASRRQSGSHNHHRPKRRLPRRYHRDQHDAADTLCSIIFCNSNYTARVLFELLSEMSRQDPGLKFIKCQFTTDRVADPITEPREAEAEHRRQEEVLKRFRMHDSNVLIGTSVLEEGIDVPKCNLVVRWDPPTTYRSYVQCKGRARAIPAYHVLLVASDWKDLVDFKAETEQISNNSHRLICALPEDELTDFGQGDEETTEDEEDKQINGISTKQKFVYGTSKGTIKILNPEVITTKPPKKPSSSSNDLVLKEIKDETLAIEDVKYSPDKNEIKDVYDYSANNKNSTMSVLNEEVKNTSENSISSYKSNTSSVIESNTSHRDQILEEVHETDGSSDRLNDTNNSSENINLNESSCSSILSKYNEEDIYKVFNMEEAIKELENISNDAGNTSYQVKTNAKKSKAIESNVPEDKANENGNENIVPEKKERKKFACLLQTESDDIESENLKTVDEAKQFENMENTTNTIVQQMAEYREIEKV